MNKSPCFPFYPSDFFGDVKVRIMSPEARAFYLLLLANIWEYDTQFSIPNDEKIISNLLGIFGEKFSAIFKEILPCFQEKNGRLLSKRLKHEKDKQVYYRKQQSIKGLKSASKRVTTVQPQFNHGSTGGVTEGQPDTQPEVNSSKPKPKPKPIIKEKKEKKKNEFFLPDWIPIETWQAYLAVRVKKKAPQTPYAFDLVIKELEKIKKTYGHDPIEVLNKSIKGGWTDVYPLKDFGGNGNGITTPSNRFSNAGYRGRPQEFELPPESQRAVDEANRLAREKQERIAKKSATDNPQADARGDPR
ncbi:MAG: hypothetical protein PHD04_03915 [Candidatus Pacebacteria bacterium]|nr:hypothetical protein [Candidatus Paceibacterota bacterium]